MLAWFNTPIQNWIKLWSVCFCSVGFWWHISSLHVLALSFSVTELFSLFYNYLLHVTDWHPSSFDSVTKKVPNDSFQLKLSKSCENSCIFHVTYFIRRRKKRKNIAMSVISSIMQLYCGTSLSPKPLTLMEYWMEVCAMCLLNNLRCK